MTGGQHERVDHVARLEARLARGRIGPNRDDAGPDRIAEAQAGDVDGLAWPDGELGPGRRVVGGHGQRLPSGCLPAPASRSTSNVIGLPAFAKQISRAAASGRSRLAVDLDDPVSLAEAGRLRRRVLADAADRLDLQPEAEVDEMVGRDGQLELLDRGAVVLRTVKIGLPLDHVRDRPVGVAGRAGDRTRKLSVKRRRLFAGGAGRDQDVDLRLAFLRLRAPDNVGGFDHPGEGLEIADLQAMARAGCRSSGRSAVASRRGWMSRPISPSCPGRLTSKWRTWPCRAEQRSFFASSVKPRSRRSSIATISSPARRPAS